jgi:diaminopimelate decarboxylase
MSEPAQEAFALRDGALHCEDADLAGIAARVGTPVYVYSRRAILEAYGRYVRALGSQPSMVCYSVKANSNLAVLQMLAQAGSGFDIVSGGELARVLAAGAPPRRVVFSGVGKTEAEMRAALQCGIACFNVESEAELIALDRVARAMGRRAPVSLRINPDVDPGTHPYISTGMRLNKFGIDVPRAEELYGRAADMAGIELAGVDMHIGSQVTTVAPFLDAAQRLLDLVDRLCARGLKLRHIDVGGGLGIAYRSDAPAPGIEEFLGALLDCLARRGHADKTLIVEPGRSIVGNAGVLLTRVLYLKESPEKDFAIVDAAMNDLLRPALYDAWMDVVAVVPHSGARRTYDVVGPVCESADWLGRGRELALREGDLLAVRGAGAYGMSMASNYNSRVRPAEVVVDGGRVHLVRRREATEELFASEALIAGAGGA